MNLQEVRRSIIEPALLLLPAKNGMPAGDRHAARDHTSGNRDGQMMGQAPSLPQYDFEVQVLPSGRELE